LAAETPSRCAAIYRDCLCVFTVTCFYVLALNKKTKNKNCSCARECGVIGTKLKFKCPCLNMLREDR